MNQLKSMLTCSYCSRIFKYPIELPCTHSICREHLTEDSVRKLDKIKCAVCNEEFIIKENEFKSCHLVKQLLDSKCYLNEEEKSLKQKIEESIRNVHEMCDQFEITKNTFDSDCHNHFQEIRRQIDLHREKLIEKIDNIYMDMIDRTKACEASYMKSLNENQKAFFKSFKAPQSVEKDLEDSDITFRNPNILLTTLNEMLQKQEQTLEGIKLKINEFNQIKSNLKAFYSFKPNVAFVEESFGLLYLNDSFKSEILIDEQSSELIKLCEFSPTDKWSLLYRGTRDGFGAKDFHSKCDGHSNTLTLLKAKQSSYIFGGFTSASWDCSNKTKCDPRAFIFSLTNKDNRPCKMVTTKAFNSIQCMKKFGPIFGGFKNLPTYNDIFKADNANLNEISYSDLGYTYKNSHYKFDSNEAKTFLAGSYCFQLSEIEVYQKE
jgi:hypothetical protein